MTEALLKSINIVGSRKKLADLIDVSPEVVNAWLNKGVQIPLQYAIEIQRLTQNEVTWPQIAPHLASFGKRWPYHEITTSQVRFQSQRIPLSNIILDNNLPETNNLSSSIDNINIHEIQRAICVDTDNRLIFGIKRFLANQVLNNKTILVWRLSLPDLISGKYIAHELQNIFSWSERIVIGFAIEKKLGDRRGQRNDLSLRQKIVEVKGRTDDLIAKILNFGNREYYNRSKKIYRCGCPELINAIDEGEISIVAGVLLATLPNNQQQQILALSTNEILAAVNHIKLNSRLTDADQFTTEENEV